ncbi:MAG: hypothetical protein ABSD76_21135 [Terriglobales bacterium]
MTLARPYAVRKPKRYAVPQPGDLGQVDTFDARPVPGVVFKQLTAPDGGLALKRFGPSFE